MFLRNFPPAKKEPQGFQAPQTPLPRVDGELRYREQPPALACSAERNRCSASRQFSRQRGSNRSAVTATSWSTAHASRK